MGGNELALFSDTEKTVTTKELAEQLKTSPKVVLENAKKCLPNKRIENGKPTYWSKTEITILIEQMKTSNPNQYTFTGAVKAISTDLTPALKIKKAMELMQEGYEEELAILRAKNAEKQAIIEQQDKQLEEQKPQVAGYKLTMDSDGTYSMAESAKLLKLPYGNVTLFRKLRDLGILDKNNIPLQEYVNRGYFIVITKPIVKGTVTENTLITRVTAKGIDYIARKLGLIISKEVA